MLLAILARQQEALSFRIHLVQLLQFWVIILKLLSLFNTVHLILFTMIRAQLLKMERLLRLEIMLIIPLLEHILLSIQQLITLEILQLFLEQYMLLIQRRREFACYQIY